MNRPVLDEKHLHPGIRQLVAALHRDAIQQVQTAIHSHSVVVVGMDSNPFVRKARRALDAAGVAHEYLVFGGYTSQWRRRNALKMWTGWPTFPMVFVRGMLIGGAAEVQRLIAMDELKGLLEN
ncbi:MAG: glutaredoxin [Hydrogenophaga sp.]|uniref:glutaredoxin n=1 Tax=Hydrogenophaga sp. TaxID=1904254 RepID=UPI00274B8A13|nr:glutaredoxin [Hydrogenophaga sp.]MDP2416969.1 glutaredoxin [Hydrogenophaga sp.]MDZ4188465.1 glutaredoxin [Hydrogenophaga sp.]